MTHRGPFQPLLFCDSVKYLAYGGFFLNMCTKYHLKVIQEKEGETENIYERNVKFV